MAYISTSTLTVKARVRDRLSGIPNERFIVITLDGEKTISEYDPERYSVTYKPEEPLQPGEHFVEVWAKDNCGNESSERIIFTITGNR